jgi:hypothetical protein
MAGVKRDEGSRAAPLAQMKELGIIARGKRLLAVAPAQVHSQPLQIHSLGWVFELNLSAATSITKLIANKSTIARAHMKKNLS